MELILDTYGSALKVKNSCFQVTVNNEKHLFAPGKIERILITNAIMITSDVMLLAMQNNIDIIFLDKYGNPYSRVWHSKLGSTTLIRRKQLLLEENAMGLKIAQKIIIRKLTNQIHKY